MSLPDLAEVIGELPDTRREQAELAVDLLTFREQIDAMLRTLTPPDATVRLIEDDTAVDIGDWLPQDEDHYNAVGPFHIDGKPATWDEWWADPDHHVENWVSVAMVIDVHHPDGEVDEWAAALHGLDFLYFDQPVMGKYTPAQLVTEHARKRETRWLVTDVLPDLLSELDLEHLMPEVPDLPEEEPSGTA